MSRKRRNTKWNDYRPKYEFETYKKTVLNFEHVWQSSDNPWWTNKFCSETDGKTTYFTWREIARMIIEDQIKYLNMYHRDASPKDRLDFVNHFFPFGSKERTPYQSWLRERKDLTAKIEVCE